MGTDRGADRECKADPGRVDEATLVDQRNALTGLLFARGRVAAERIRGLEEGMEALRASRSFRLIAILSAARQDWRDTLRLPWRLLRLAFAKAPPAVAAQSPSAEVPAAVRVPPRAGKPNFKLIAVVDEFTEHGLRGECDLLLPAPGVGSDEFDAFDADMLLVESAWRGNRSQWRKLITPASDALIELLDYCRERGIPTVFWNKEDPVHFEHFLGTARLFDVILTTDADSVPAYRARTGRKDIGVLPFACQPSIHNPIETEQRKDAFFFAGSYYAKYPERQRDFEALVAAIAPMRDIDIYDRNHGSGIPEFRFPDRYSGMLKGRVEPDAIHRIYKSYRYAINLNSITESHTMFSRRVFELLACNTLVVSNYSEGIRRTFGTAVVAPSDRDALRGSVAEVLTDETEIRRRNLLGLRTVMASHTWEDRLLALRRYATDRIETPPPRPVWVVAVATGFEQAERMVRMYRAQTCPATRLLLLTEDDAVQHAWRSDEGIEAISGAAARSYRLDRGAAVAGWWGGDTYGPNYLFDLMLTVRYAPADAAGKACHVVRRDSACERVGDAQRYRYVDALDYRSAVLFGGAVPDTAADLAAALATGRIVGGALFSADEFNYCRDGAGELPQSADDSLDRAALARGSHSTGNGHI